MRPRDVVLRGELVSYVCAINFIFRCKEISSERKNQYGTRSVKKFKCILKVRNVQKVLQETGSKYLWTQHLVKVGRTLQKVIHWRQNNVPLKHLNIVLQGDPTEIKTENVERTMRSTKNRTAGGQGGITAETVKNGTGKLKRITVIFNKCIDQEITLEEWKTRFMSSTQKKM
jgi:hypothetical protein